MATEDRCTLIFNPTNLEELPERLRFVFGPEACQVEGSDAAWQKITVQKRRLIRKVGIVIQLVGATELPRFLEQMQHVFRVVQTENTLIQEKLLVRIATSRAALEIQAPGGFRGLEAVVFEVARFFDALIFWENDKVLDPKGKLVLDLVGNTVLEDLPVAVDAELLDQFTPQSPEGEARKARTIAFLESKKVPYSSTLPYIEGEGTAEIRSQAAVTDRALALLLVALKGEGLPDTTIAEIRQDYGIEAGLSPNEQAFLEDPNPIQKTRINFAWRYEGLWVMLWAMGLIEDMGFPDKICDVPKMMEAIRTLGSAKAIHEAAQLRTTTEILDQADLIYRLNWACVNARLKGEAAPAGLEPGVVYERHYAFNWLRSYFQQPWDEVRTDT